MHVTIRISKAYADQLRGSQQPMLHMSQIELVRTEDRVLRIECHPAGRRCDRSRYVLTISDFGGGLAETVLDWAEQAAVGGGRRPPSGRLESADWPGRPLTASQARGRREPPAREERPSERKHSVQVEADAATVS